MSALLPAQYTYPHAKQHAKQTDPFDRPNLQISPFFSSTPRRLLMTSSNLQTLQSPLWVEKQIPLAVTDVANHTQAVPTLQTAVKESAQLGDLPHLLFYCPPGTGRSQPRLPYALTYSGPRTCAPASRSSMRLMNT